MNECNLCNKKIKKYRRLGDRVHKIVFRVCQKCYDKHDGVAGFQGIPESMRTY